MGRQHGQSFEQIQNRWHGCGKDDEVRAGEKAVVSIRPEKIRLSEEPALQTNCFKGQVTNTTYIGSDTHVYVDVGGQKMKVWEQNKISSLDPKAYYALGQNVCLNLFPENTLVLAES